MSEGHQIGLIVTQRLKSEYSHIKDVTFHIDAEDDDHNGEHVTSASLPLRNDVIKTLKETWKETLKIEDNHRLNLHYLNNQISIDLFIDSPDEPPANLLSTLQEQAKSIEWLGELTLWHSHQ